MGAAWLIREVTAVTLDICTPVLVSGSGSGSDRGELHRFVAEFSATLGFVSSATSLFLGGIVLLASVWLALVLPKGRSRKLAFGGVLALLVGLGSTLPGFLRVVGSVWDDSSVPLRVLVRTYLAGDRFLVAAGLIAAAVAVLRELPGPKPVSKAWTVCLAVAWTLVCVAPMLGSMLEEARWLFRLGRVGSPAVGLAFAGLMFWLAARAAGEDPPGSPNGAPFRLLGGVLIARGLVVTAILVGGRLWGSGPAVPLTQALAALVSAVLAVPAVLALAAMLRMAPPARSTVALGLALISLSIGAFVDLYGGYSARPSKWVMALMFLTAYGTSVAVLWSLRRSAVWLEDDGEAATATKLLRATIVLPVLLLCVLWAAQVSWDSSYRVVALFVLGSLGVFLAAATPYVVVGVVRLLFHLGEQVDSAAGRRPEAGSA